MSYNWYGKIKPLINPVNTRGTCSDKTYYFKICFCVQRGFIPNFLFIATTLTEIVKLTHKLTHLLALLALEGHFQIKPNITILKIVFGEAKYQISYS